MTRMSLERRIEALLWSAGLGCAALCVVIGILGHRASVVAAAIEVPEAAGGPTKHSEASGMELPNALEPGTVIGRMEVPRLRLVVPILSAYDSESLRRGVGHIEGTALPGGLGTVGLAGHRDTFLRPLRNVAPGMEIRLVAHDGGYTYLVDRTEIVAPEEVSVLATGNRPELAVVTCYPFYYVGAAPKRFVVHAHLLSLLPEPKH